MPLPIPILNAATAKISADYAFRINQTPGLMGGLETALKGIEDAASRGQFEYVNHEAGSAIPIQAVVAELNALGYTAKVTTTQTGRPSYKVQW